MPKRLKILISAYACSPVRGSEPGVGWGFVKALAKYHDLWVIVEQEKFQAEIEDELKRNPAFAEHVHFFFIHKKRNRTLRKIWPPSYYWYYQKWHLDAYELAQQFYKEIHFDLAHQLTMVGFREPGYLWKLGIPFVWGPVGGMGLFPWKFFSIVGVKGFIYFMGYNIFNLIHMHYLDRPRKAARFAASVLVATPENQAAVEKLWGVSCILISEVGLPHEPVTTIQVRNESEPIKIVWTGQHKPGKALNLALMALANLHSEIKWELNILGEGPETKKWKNFAKQLSIEKNCKFHGSVERVKALRIMEESHVMLITSLRDLTSTVAIEALALGLPIICLDHCGFSYVVTDDCGFKIPVTTPQKVSTEIANRVERLWKNEELRQSMAAEALNRAKEFTWDNKASQVCEIYNRVLADK